MNGYNKGKIKFVITSYKKHKIQKKKVVTVKGHKLIDTVIDLLFALLRRAAVLQYHSYCIA